MTFKVLLLLLPVFVFGIWSPKANTSKGNVDEHNCFCQLKGMIDDCSCSIETIDSFNNLKIYPRLNSLLQKDYFRYWKVNLNKGCPFWEDDSKCTIRFCSVQECQKVPDGIKKASSLFQKQKYLQKENTDVLEADCDKEGDLGYLNTTISEESKAHFEKWAAHDSAQDDSFCYLDDETSEQSRYVDLLLNPERFTGYAGDSAHRVWRAIYQENCFKPSQSATFSEFSNMREMCLEKRTFYRALSGLHSSINVHLSAKYLLSENDDFMNHPEGFWGANLREFQLRFDPAKTNGAGPNRLKNLYFLYLLELKAIAKVSPYLRSIAFFTGNEIDDVDTKEAIKDILSVVELFPDHFDEGMLFSSKDEQMPKLKSEFRDHFRNISRIMDCVGCDKCRLWGKLQVTGLGTALKILFSGKFDPISDAKKINFHLTRNEIVALFNAFGRLSTSIAELESFRKLLQHR